MADQHLALTDQPCPRPLIAVIAALRNLKPGDTLTVDCRDPLIRQSVPKLCERSGFTVAEMRETDGVIHFAIRK